MTDEEIKSIKECLIKKGFLCDEDSSQTQIYGYANDFEITFVLSYCNNGIGFGRNKYESMHVQMNQKSHPFQQIGVSYVRDRKQLNQILKLGKISMRI